MTTDPNDSALSTDTAPDSAPSNPDPGRPLQPGAPGTGDPTFSEEGRSETAPAPGGPNDPGASASNDNQADTPGYSGGGDADPTMSPSGAGTGTGDFDGTEESDDESADLQGDDPASGGS